MIPLLTHTVAIFVDYLFDNKYSNSESYGTKFDEIVTNLLIVMRNPKYIGFKVYVVGHSLGAALSTIFAYFLASKQFEEVPNPVSNISIASPYCGDKNWRDSFMVSIDADTRYYFNCSLLFYCASRRN